MTRETRRTSLRFATVGAANTVIDVGLFWLLVSTWGVFSANLLSTTAGMTFSFLVNGRHTFGASRLTVRQALLFLGTNSFTMWLLQPAVMYAFHAVADAPLVVAKLAALAGSVVANFLLYRYVVWPREPQVSDTVPAEPVSSTPGPIARPSAAPTF